MSIACWKSLVMFSYEAFLGNSLSSVRIGRSSVFFYQVSCLVVLVSTIYRFSEHPEFGPSKTWKDSGLYFFGWSGCLKDFNLAFCKMALEVALSSSNALWVRSSKLIMVKEGWFSVQMVGSFMGIWDKLLLELLNLLHCMVLFLSLTSFSFKAGLCDTYSILESYLGRRETPLFYNGTNRLYHLDQDAKIVLNWTRISKWAQWSLAIGLGSRVNGNG
ncbi:hypothetical protein Tco_1549567 [Tanacetum coccineum]